MGLFFFLVGVGGVFWKEFSVRNEGAQFLLLFKLIVVGGGRGWLAHFQRFTVY